MFLVLWLWALVTHNNDVLLLRHTRKKMQQPKFYCFLYLYRELSIERLTVYNADKYWKTHVTNLSLNFPTFSMIQRHSAEAAMLQSSWKVILRSWMWLLLLPCSDMASFTMLCAKQLLVWVFCWEPAVGK